MATRKAKAPVKDVGAFISHMQAMTTYQVGDIFYYRENGGVFEGKVISIMISLRDHLGKPTIDICYNAELKGVSTIRVLRCHEMKRSPENAFR